LPVSLEALIGVAIAALSKGIVDEKIFGEMHKYAVDFDRTSSVELLTPSVVPVALIATGLIWYVRITKTSLL
jgi:hypothetical protein